jgi:hypothetical protein
MKSFLNLIKKEKVFIIISTILLFFAGLYVYNQLDPIKKSVPGVSLPSGFPVIPLYKDATLVDSTSDPTEGALYIGVRYGATWETKDEIPVVSRWYKEKLQELGWTLDTESKDPEAKDVQLASFYNDEYTLNLSLIRNEGSGVTKIVAEFNTHLRDYCDDSDGKVCK